MARREGWGEGGEEGGRAGRGGGGGVNDRAHLRKLEEAEDMKPLRHTSHVTRHTPHVTPHTSHLTRHTSHITHHTSHITRTTPQARLMQVNCVVHMHAPSGEEEAEVEGTLCEGGGGGGGGGGGEADA